MTELEALQRIHGWAGIAGPDYESHLSEAFAIVAQLIQRIENLEQDPIEVERLAHEVLVEHGLVVVDCIPLEHVRNDLIQQGHAGLANRANEYLAPFVEQALHDAFSNDVHAETVADARHEAVQAIIRAAQDDAEGAGP
jgi:hypothetical protein